MRGQQLDGQISATATVASELRRSRSSHRRSCARAVDNDAIAPTRSPLSSAALARVSNALYWSPQVSEDPANAGARFCEPSAHCRGRLVTKQTATTGPKRKLAKRRMCWIVGKKDAPDQSTENGCFVRDRCSSSEHEPMKRASAKRDGISVGLRFLWCRAENRPSSCWRRVC